MCPQPGQLSVFRELNNLFRGLLGIAGNKYWLALSAVLVVEYLHAFP